MSSCFSRSICSFSFSMASLFFFSFSSWALQIRNSHNKATKRADTTDAQLRLTNKSCQARTHKKKKKTQSVKRIYKTQIHFTSVQKQLWSKKKTSAVLLLGSYTIHHTTFAGEAFQFEITCHLQVFGNAITSVLKSFDRWKKTAARCSTLPHVSPAVNVVSV